MAAPKPVLGKGLGQLMGGRGVAGKPGVVPSPPSGAAEKVTPVDFGRGMTTLVTAAPPRTEPVPAKKNLLPAWFYFAADLLLLGFTVVICQDAPKPLDFATVVFAAMAVTLGGVFGITGIFQSRKEAAPPEASAASLQ